MAAAQFPQVKASNGYSNCSCFSFFYPPVRSAAISSEKQQVVASSSVVLFEILCALIDYCLSSFFPLNLQ